MKLLTLSIALLLLTSLYAREAQSTNFMFHPDHNVTRIKKPLPQFPTSDLPTNYSWANVSGVNYLTEMRNHHIPTYCGGCYSFASSSTLSDRIKIMRNASWPDIVIAPQMILSCTPNFGCGGGSPSVAFEYIAEFGITDETCSPYRALGNLNGAPCTDLIKCSVCDANGTCHVPESYPVYYVEEHGVVSGEEAMMNEIFQRGPIACSIDAMYMQTYNGTIINVQNKTWGLDHIVECFGWGVEDGIPYWHLRNSWGAFWGIDGFFKVIRGVNSLGVETGCGWATLVDTWTNNTRNYTNTSNNAQSKKEERSFTDVLKGEKKAATEQKAAFEKPSCVVINESITRVPSVFGNDTWRNTNLSDIPASSDWRNASGTNFLSWTRVENNPLPCGACWAHAATSSIADRVMIKRNHTFPEVSVSPQVLINCQGGGNCSGGDPYAVFQYANLVGIPEDSCQNYLAKNPLDDFACAPEDICKNCEPPTFYPNGTVVPHCMAINVYEVFTVSDYGILSGVDDMKRAIYAEGPIVCGIEFTEALSNYKKGTHKERIEGATVNVPNQYVSVVGWNTDENGTDYWIVRNSWGSYWGNYGYFNIAMGNDSLGLEDECIWGTPVVSTRNTTAAANATNATNATNGTVGTKTIKEMRHLIA